MSTRYLVTESRSKTRERCSLFLPDVVGDSAPLFLEPPALPPSRISQFMQLGLEFPYPLGSFVPAGGRVEAARLIGEALKADQDAIANIEAALAHIEGSR